MVVEGLDQLLFILVVAQKIELFGEELLNDAGLGQNQILREEREGGEVR